jgi:hypothetical protein
MLSRVRRWATTEQGGLQPSVYVREDSRRDSRARLDPLVSQAYRRAATGHPDAAVAVTTALLPPGHRPALVHVEARRQAAPLDVRIGFQLCCVLRQDAGM